MLWQPYHQRAEENAAGEMGSVSHTNVYECEYSRVASAEVCEHRRCVAGWVQIHICRDVMYKCWNMCLPGVPSASEGMGGVYGMIYLSGTECVLVHLIPGDSGGRGVTLKEIFLMTAIV